MHLTPGVVHNFPFEKRREFWSLVSAMDGSILSQDYVEEQLC